MKRILLALTLVTIIAAGGGFYWYKANAIARVDTPAAAPKVTAAAITVTRARVVDFVETAVVAGTLVPREEILVSPEVEGFRTLELLVDEGSRVTKGQVLARLVKTQLEAQAAQNDASLARAQASIAQAQSQITEIEARVAEAQAQFQRAKPLKESGYLSGAVYDQRESAAKTAGAQLLAARDALKAAEADRTLVEAQRQELNWRRDNTEVTSPADGIVSRRNARIGTLATAIGEPMFRIIANGEIEMDAEIVETELSKVREGQKATIVVPGSGEAAGLVRLVSPEIDKTTRLGKVKIFLGSNPQLRIGSFARGAIETAKSRGIALPSASVMFDAAGAYVQLVRTNRVVKRSIKTGLVSGDAVEVTAGVDDGDLVVARAGTFLRDGDVIRPVEPDPKISEAK